MSEAIVVPLKRFDQAKRRLRRGSELDVTSIAAELARGVIVNSQPRLVVVVSEDEAVGHFAASLGAEVWPSTATNLNDAVQGAFAGLGQRFDRLIVAHGDLSHPAGLGTFELEPGVTLYADHHGQGTNVLVVPTNLDFHFADGPGSLERHVAESRRLGVDFRVVRDSPWRFDVDEPGDLPSA